MGKSRLETFSEAERGRLEEDARRTRDWKRWGPYLSERQWSTVREDYSADGDSWRHFPHEQARSRVYRWGEDGLLGITDRQGRLCFGLSLWNGKDPFLKERLFGLTGKEGNHGEDVKECYYYLDATPTHSYLKALYKYPQGEFPYARLLAENQSRGPDDREFELADTGIFDDNRYFDVFAEYAKGSPNDLCIRVTVHNRSAAAAELHVLPTLWFRNTWSWGRQGEGYFTKGVLEAASPTEVGIHQASLGEFHLFVAPLDGAVPELLFTDNESNAKRLFGVPNRAPYVKDGFHDRVVNGDLAAVNPAQQGTKAAAWYLLKLEPGASRSLQLRLCSKEEAPKEPFGASFSTTFDNRIAEAEGFWAGLCERATPSERPVLRQAYAGLLWSQQFYCYDVQAWLEGDPAGPKPPVERLSGRNSEWRHLYNRDVLSMPDSWEYPWFAAWDLAFHMLPLARVDAELAKSQLVLLLREWYMHPNGQLPAYEFAFGDVNPPVHGWAAWRVYKISAPKGQRDATFLARVFHKLLLNFTWWVNRKDAEGRNLFSGGFLGLDNIGVFDRSKPLPMGGTLEQADATAWMAFYCTTMLSMGLELAVEQPAYEDMASKFFEHFISIVDAMNSVGGQGLWDEQDGFYYDQLQVDSERVSLKVRSMVGLIPLIAVAVLDVEDLDRVPGFTKRLTWFLENRTELAKHIQAGEGGSRLLALVSKEKLVRVLRYLLDENEFLSPYGIRSLSRFHEKNPYLFQVDGEERRVDYVAGESNSGLFGGNSNWRGPVWFPVNYLLIEALETYHHFYGDAFRVECPTGSGKEMNLAQVASELNRRLSRLFLPDAEGRRPCHGTEARYSRDAAFRDLILFYEYFDPETGRGCGASHQTGWTSLVTRCIEAEISGRQAPELPAAVSRPPGR